MRITSFLAGLLFLAGVCMGQQMKFTKVIIKDPQMGNMDACTLLIPEGWKTEGGIYWMPNFSMQANLLMRVSDPKSGAAIDFLPAQQFCMPMQDPSGLMPIGTNWNGSMVYPPPRDAEEFVKTIHMPQTLAHLQKAKLVKKTDLDKWAREVQKSIPAQMQIKVTATRLRYAYNLGGRDWEEDVYSLLSYAPQNQYTAMWWCSGHSLRAPAGELDKLTPTMMVPVRTARLTLDWSAGLEQVKTLFRQGNMQVMADQRRVHEQWRANQAELRRQHQQVWEERQAVQDKQNFALREILGGSETYKDPYEARNIELPQGYKDYWVDRNGTYILSNDVNFDPRVGSTGDWRKMDRFQP